MIIELASSTRFRNIAIAALSACALYGCETFGETVPDHNDAVAAGPRVVHAPPLSAYSAPLTSDMVKGLSPIIERGQEDARPLMGAPPPNVGDGNFVMNFDGVDVRDVAKTVLGDQLGLNYSVDPTAKATLTLHTAAPLTREAVIPALSNALRVAGLALTRQGTDYRILPLTDGSHYAPFASKLGNSQDGYQIRVIPLHWVSPAEIGHALDPLLPSGAVIAGDLRSSFVVVAGSPNDLDRAVRAVSLFDVDWMRKRSFALFPLKYSSASEVANDLTAIVGKEGAGDDGVKITPIEHLNAILIVSKTYDRITRLRGWIERFDRGRDVLAPKIYIYRVQNGSAKELAALVSKVFGANDESGGEKAGSPSVGTPNSNETLGVQSSSVSANAETQGAYGTLTQAMNAAGAPGGFVPLGGSSARGQETGGRNRDLRITADESENSLVIVTTPTLYARVEAALAQLDSAPVQVLIEAAIAEIDLTDTFQYGVQASVQKGALSVLSSNTPASSIGPTAGGLSVALSWAGYSATLNLLSTLTKTKVISAPKIMVVNNKPASLQVGDQVPVATASAVSTQSFGAPIVNTIQMVDTGIILHVTPHVNNSGLVMLDLGQEVSASVPTLSSTIDSPTIQQRKVATTVQLEDGQTIIIGGLISDTRGRNRTGVPYLKDVPVLGSLFGTTNDTTNRTELMVILTPHIIRNGRDADEATEELRSKLPMLQDVHVK